MFLRTDWMILMMLNIRNKVYPRLLIDLLLSKQPGRFFLSKSTQRKSPLSECGAVRVWRMWNATWSGSKVVGSSSALQAVFPLVLAAALGVFILVTIVGNLFVMIAVLAENHLKRASSALIFSLALADFMVASLVMPLGALYEVTQEWTLGPVLCEIWTCCDVMCCTASILHLLAIATDRYWSVTRVDYRRTPLRLATVIGLIWTSSLVVSCAPLFGWKDQDFLDRIEVSKQCLVSQDVSYQIFATCATFYIPLVFILLLYWRIFQVARKRIRHRLGDHKAMLLVQEPSSSNAQDKGPDLLDGTGGSRLLLLARRERTRETLEAKRERKAAKTLVIITGVFVVCWLPFFVTALVQALRPDDALSPTSPLLSVFLWLGYANSLFNPLIYTIFSPDFRNAFRKILCGPGSARSWKSWRG